MQTRNGFNGHAFRIVKFRSMHVLEDGGTIRQATRDDPRVTRIGRWLRRTNIDELPQLFNVLYGDMSLIGPRPHAAAHNSEYEKLIANYAFRYHVKPGITGWAQVNGFRGETPSPDVMEKRVELDLWYISNWTHVAGYQDFISNADVGYSTDGLLIRSESYEPSERSARRRSSPPKYDFIDPRDDACMSSVMCPAILAAQYVIRSVALFSSSSHTGSNLCAM